MVHSRHDYERAVQAAQILFGNATVDALKSLSESEILAVLEGITRFELPLALLSGEGADIVALLGEQTKVLPSKGEARKAIDTNSISINKQKINDTKLRLKPEYLLHEKYLLAQHGKKNYFLLVFA